MRVAQAACAAVVAEAHQTLDPILFIQPMPSADGVVVQIQDLRGRLAAHPVVQQQQRVGPSGQAMRSRSVPRQFGQVLTRFGVEEASADHAMTRVAAELIRKGLFRVPAESGYTLKSRTK